MKKYFKKIFLITSILLLTFSLNGLVFATDSCNNYNFDKDKYLTRLNNVLNKVKTGNTSAKMQTLLSRLKTKYSNYPSIKGMIGYLNYNIDNSFVCITDNTTNNVDDTTNTGTTNICNEKAKDGMSCTSGGHVASNWGWCSKEGKIYYDIEEAYSKGLACYESIHNDKCNNKINNDRTCTGSGYVSTENARCLGNTYLGTLKNANALGVSCSLKKNTTNTGTVTEKQKCDKSYESIYVSNYYNSYFKKYFNLKEAEDRKFLSTRGYDYYYFQGNNKNNYKTKLFFPKGIKATTLMLYFLGFYIQRCDAGIDVQYWIGPNKPSQKGVLDNDLWDGKYLQTTLYSETNSIRIVTRDYRDYDDDSFSKEGAWIYFDINSGCELQEGKIVIGYQIGDYKTYEEWYENMKWEKNGDPEYDCKY